MPVNCIICELHLNKAIFLSVPEMDGERGWHAKQLSSPQKSTEDYPRPFSHSLYMLKVILEFPTPKIPIYCTHWAVEQ